MCNNRLKLKFDSHIPFRVSLITPYTVFTSEYRTPCQYIIRNIMKALICIYLYLSYMLNVHHSSTKKKIYFQMKNMLIITLELTNDVSDLFQIVFLIIRHSTNSFLMDFSHKFFCLLFHKLSDSVRFKTQTKLRFRFLKSISVLKKNIDCIHFAIKTINFNFPHSLVDSWVMSIEQINWLDRLPNRFSYYVVFNNQ